jgi:hypothetical protein
MKDPIVFLSGISESARGGAVDTVASTAVGSS